MSNNTKTKNQMSFGTKLAAVDKTTRDRGVKKLSQWLISREQLSELDFMKVWKALYYCFWLSDKPLVQQDLAEQLANLVLVLGHKDLSKAFLYFKTFLLTMEREWSTIDVLRMDKYLMIVRKFVGQALALLKQHKWDPKLIQQYNALIQEHPLSVDSNRGHLGIKLHYSDIFLEEIHKLAGNECPFELIESLYPPFYNVLAHAKSATLLKRVIKRQFNEFITFWLPLEEEEEEDEDDTKQEGEQDQFFIVDFAKISETVHKLAAAKDTLQENRSHLYRLAEEMAEMANEQNGNNDVELDDEENDDMEEEEEEEEEQVPPPKKGKNQNNNSNNNNAAGTNNKKKAGGKSEKVQQQAESQSQNGKKRKPEVEKVEETPKKGNTASKKQKNETETAAVNNKKEAAAAANNKKQSQKKEQKEVEQPVAEPSKAPSTTNKSQKEEGKKSNNNNNKNASKAKENASAGDAKKGEQSVASKPTKGNGKQEVTPEKKPAAAVITPKKPVTLQRTDSASKKVVLNMQANKAQEYADSLKVGVDSPHEKNKNMAVTSILKRRDPATPKLSVNQLKK